MNEITCPGCGLSMDISGIEPFTLCKCSGCNAETYIPLEMGHFSLEKSFEQEVSLDIYEGLDRNNDQYSSIFILGKDNPNYKVLSQIAQEEAQLLTNLKHQNICPIIDIGEVEGNFYVTEPLMDGFPLADYNPDEDGMLNIGQLINVFHFSALGLAVAHHHNIIHHNISTHNIQIDNRKNLRIKNFFISRFAWRLWQDRLLESKEEIITPHFISPEKAETGVEDKSGDIFSLGVAFYFMFTGEFPFTGKTEREVIYSRIKKKPMPQKAGEEEIFSARKPRMAAADIVEYKPPVSMMDLRKEIPDEINYLIMEMLDYSPEKRPKASQVANILDMYKTNKEHMKMELVQFEIVSTKTKAIPVMKKLGSEKSDSFKKHTLTKK